MANETPQKLIHINENLVQSQMKVVVRGTVEERLNEQRELILKSLT